MRDEGRAETTPLDGDDEEIDVGLMTSRTTPSSPIAPSWPVEKGKGVDPREYGFNSLKRRRLETPEGSDGEADDEMEADIMLDPERRKRRVSSAFLQSVVSGSGEDAGGQGTAGRDARGS